ncbi:MAG: baseplate wedge protein 53, partial [Sulfurihydrogenibium sp.]
MKPDIKEIAYRLYEEYLSEDFNDFDKEIESNIFIGAIYFKILNKKPIHFIVLRQISDKYYECLKMSSFYEFATHNDVFYHLSIERQTYIIQTDINFYLNEDEIKNSILIEDVPKEFVEELKKFTELPEDAKVEYKGLLKRGFFYPVGNKWISSFKQKELDIVKNYHLRIFEILDEIESTYDNIVNLPPERI